MAARKLKPRSKVTIEIETRLKRRLMAFCGARGERPRVVVARALIREMAKFKFEGADSIKDRLADGQADDAGDVAHRLRAV